VLHGEVEHPVEGTGHRDCGAEGSPSTNRGTGQGRRRGTDVGFGQLNPVAGHGVA
jgi:hypothetical protein